MKKHTNNNGNGGGKRRGKGKGKGKGKCKHQCSKKLCFFIESWEDFHVYVYAVDTTSEEVEGGGSIFQIGKVKPRDQTLRVGYTSLGSKIYLLGGELVPKKDRREDDEEMKEFPREVLICDLGEKIKNQNLKWEEGPSLIAGKPGPVVVTVYGKLYALVGFPLFPDEFYTEKLNPVFEVFDPADKGGWKPLPDPPFLSFYTTAEPGPRIAGHTVLGANIFVELSAYKGGGSYKITLYAFNVREVRWWVPGAGAPSPSPKFSDSDTLIIDNLTACQWSFGIDVVDYVFYACDPYDMGNVYAFDFAARMERSRDDYLVPVLLPGLETITAGENVQSGIVAHLWNDLFCLVRFYFAERDGNSFHLVSVWTFEVKSKDVLELDNNEGGREEEGAPRAIKRSLVAENVKHIADHELEFDFLEFSTW